MAELVRVDPIAVGSRHAVSLAGAVIGRAKTCEIRIADLEVSRRHVRIAYTDCGWVVEDLGSTNGCFVNGVPVRWSKLRAHDRVRIGDYYTFEFLATPGAPPEDDDEDGGAPATAQLLLS